MATWYFHPGVGVDSPGNGSIGSPCATLGYAANTLASPGDAVLGYGGSTSAENAVLTKAVTIGSYGTGQVTIAGGTGAAISCVNLDGVTINNIAATGATLTFPGGVRPIGAIEFYNSTTSTVYSTGTAVTNCTVAGAGQVGILVWCAGSTCGYQNLTITGNDVSGMIQAGILVASGSGGLGAPLLGGHDRHAGEPECRPRDRRHDGDHDRGRIGPGDRDRQRQRDDRAGPPPVQSRLRLRGIGGVRRRRSGLVLRQLRRDPSAQYRPRHVGHQWRRRLRDRDRRQHRRMRAQYNYAYNCDGSGIDCFSNSASLGSTANTFRFNLIVNCALTHQGGIWIDTYNGTNPPTLVYYNTVVGCGANPAVGFFSGGGSYQCKLYNNLLVSRAGVPMILNSGTMDATFTSDYNVYMGGNGLSPTFSVNGTTYTGLAAWRSFSGQDRTPRRSRRVRSRMCCHPTRPRPPGISRRSRNTAPFPARPGRRS